MKNFRSRTVAAVAGVTAVVIAAPLAAAAIPHTQTPVDTSASDGVIARESFNELTLDQVSQDFGVLNQEPVFTHDAPEGWTVDTHESLAGQGVEDWRGWTFTTKDHWVDAEDQMRDRFTRADGTIAVVDPDEYDDALGTGDYTFESSLTTAPVSVAGKEQIVFSFDSHYRSYESQNATVTVSFDGGPAQEILAYTPDTVTADYDEAMINANESLLVDVPAGAEEATFSFDYASAPNSWYWAIDSVTVRDALPQEPVGGPTSAWIVSDIQGDPQDMQEGFNDLHTINPDSDALLMVGDIVASGAPGEWEDIYTVMDNTEDIRPELTIAAIGNHESYSGEPWDTQKGRFLEFAQRDQVFGEYLIEGEGVDVPVLVLGQEDQRLPEVSMSEEQLNLLDQRLDYWSEQGRQVLVVSHFPLGNTTGGTFRPEYSTHHEHNDLLTEIMGDHPNSVWIAGHTHYPVGAGDWSMQRRVAGGHADGFWNVNTVTMQTGWEAVGEDTATSTEVTTGDQNYGINLEAYEDRLVFSAYDFGTTASGNADGVLEKVRELTIPNPLAGSASGAPEEPTDPEDPAGVVVESVEINEDGDFVVTYTDGTQQILEGPNSGNSGQDGSTGQDGQDGQDGESITITDTIVDEEGNTTVVFSDGTEFTIPAAKDGEDANGSSLPDASSAGPLAAVAAVLAAIGGVAWAAWQFLPNFR